MADPRRTTVARERDKGRVPSAKDSMSCDAGQAWKPVIVDHNPPHSFWRLSLASVSFNDYLYMS